MTDIKLDLLTGDLDLVEVDGVKNLVLTNPIIETVEQRLFIKLRTFQGEWFMNTDFGIPYFQLILVKGVTQAVVDSIIKREILATQGVVSIIEYTSSLDTATRKYEAQFLVKEASGEQITVTI